MTSNIETIAGMKVIRLIGKGGMSEVYEVENARLGIRHAVKVYSCAKDHPEIKARFETEGRLLAKLSHPRIVRVLDYGVDHDTERPYFVMDLVLNPDGAVQSLGDVPAGMADEEMVGRWYDDIREGLAYVHGKGVVHRDLKLQNVLIGPDGRAVITDFGISRILDLDGERGTIVDPVQTIVNMRDGKHPVMGSVGYMAPELEMGAPATEKSDWYALGVIVYRLLTGTWCDARTDILDVLSTYDPVWTKLLPGLLHSNPDGRKCLSFADERSRLLARESDLQEETICRLQKEVEREKEGGAEAVESLRRRFAVRLKLCCAVLLLSSVAVSVLAYVAWRQAGVAESVQAKVEVPDFDSVFSIPSAAAEDEKDGVPSLESFRHAMLDALVLTREMFSDLKKGLITRDKVGSMLREMSGKAAEDDNSLFSGLPEGFISSGETEALAILLNDAAEKLKEAE